MGANAGKEFVPDPGPGRAAPVAGVWPRALWLVLFAVAFGYLEGAVVVYLRELYYPDGFRFPTVLPPSPILAVELGRELATLIMLGAAAALAFRRGWSRFGAFSLMFGVWDLVYYLTLRVVLGWPESLLTWDILFLLPLVWAGPVLSAVLVAAALCVAGIVIMARVEAGFRPRAGMVVWVGAGFSLALLLYAFMANHAEVTAGVSAELRFPWVPYAVGNLLGWGTFGAAFLRGGSGTEADRPGSRTSDGGLV
jgi:hypothetical protein